MLTAFCDATGIPPAACAMIGDSTHDLDSGRAAGMVTVAVLTGVATRADLTPHADVVLARHRRPARLARAAAGMTERRSRRGGGHAGHARGEAAQAIRQMPWRIPLNPDRPTEPLPPEGVAAIHDAAMRVLEEVGIDFLNPEARDYLAAAGCRIDGATVFMDRGFVMEQVAKAPRQFDMTPRNPARRVTMGGGHMCFVNVSSPPNAMDLDNGRRVGNMTDFRNLIRLTQYFNCIHVAGGYPVEPVDVHASVRHLDCLYEKLTLTDKVVHAYSLGAERVEDVIEMTRIASGLPQAEFESQPRLFTNINSSSPLKHDFPMLDGAMRFARRGQPVIVTPFTLAGAMAPVTMAGAVVQSIAEALAAIALLQVIRPGVACMIGTFTSNVDMKSGAPAFGTPEYMRATQMTGQMARFYGLPLQGLERLRLQRPRRTGDVGEHELALVGGAVGRQPRLPRRRLAGGRADRLLREVRDGLRGPATDRALFRADPDRHLARRAGDRGDCRRRPQRSLLRCRTYQKPLQHSLLRAIPQRLAQLRGLAGGRLPHHRAARQPHLEGDPRRIRAAADGRRHPRRTRRLRRPPQARGRRADRLLTGVAPKRHALRQKSRRRLMAVDSSRRQTPELR